MPISALDSISPAFQHTKQQLTQPFSVKQWAKLALVGLLAGELSSGGGCNTSGLRDVMRQSGSHQFAAGPSLPNPMLFASMILVLAVAGFVLFILLMYVSSVMRFILFDSIIAKRCEIRKGWDRRQRNGLQYFVWQILLMLAAMAGMVILVGIPAAFALAMGWWSQPKAHMLPLILGGIVLFFVLMAFVVTFLVVHVMSKDFVVPQMAMENISAIEGWRRLLPMLKAEKGSYAGYIGMKVVMAIAASVAVGIVVLIVVLLMLIPIGGVGAAVVLGGKAAGLAWNVYTITAAVVVGLILLAFIMYVVSLISVPVIVFFPAYSIYFFASRYAPLQALIHPAPPAIPFVPPLNPLPPEAPG